MKFWREGGTKVFAHSYWVQWDHWRGQPPPRRIETRTLFQVRPPFYNGRGIGVRIGARMISVGICANAGLIDDLDGDIYDPAAEAYMDMVTARFQPVGTVVPDPTGTEPISYPGWQESKVAIDEGGHGIVFERKAKHSVAKAAQTDA